MAGELRAVAGQLSLVATPIGNLGDITPRATECLAQADAVLAEDTRRARALLRHLGIEGKRVERLDAHAERRRLDRWRERLRGGERLALVSDAGTPAVSDPGAALVRAAVEDGVEVTAVPGASAVMVALAASGLIGRGFRFVGFLPRSGASRQAALRLVATTPETVVLFESPHRMGRTLQQLAEAMPDREAVVAREMTKLHEQYLRGNLAELAEAQASRRWRGELTVVLGPHEPPPPAAQLGPAELEGRMDELLAAGLRPKQAAKALASETGLAVRALYELATRRPR